MKTQLKNGIKGTVLAMMAIVLLNTSFAGPHGHKKADKHKYYYYPKQNMYYAPLGRTYYVWDKHDRKWCSSSWGPAIYFSQMTMFPRVTLHMATERPYYYNVSHCHEYREPLLAAEVRIPVRRPERVVSPPGEQDGSRPRVQVNIDLRPVRVEHRPVYVVHDDHPGHGHAYGHHKGKHKGKHKGHGHHKGHDHD